MARVDGRAIDFLHSTLYLLHFNDSFSYKPDDGAFVMDVCNAPIIYISLFVVCLFPIPP